MVSVSLLYLDTARLGQACPSAFQAQLDFSRLSAEDPSMYSESFFREGARAWPETRIADYPGFSQWGGVEAFQARLAQHFHAPSAKQVLLASRSVVLLRLAARLMFRLCRNVLTTDLNWPHWQAIVMEEATRTGQTVSVASVKNAVLTDRVPASVLANKLEAAFVDRGCDGVFLPVVNNLGIRLPLSSLLPRLKSTGELRFTLLDAAQSFCHLPEPTPSQFADVTIAGCHKWLRGSLPLGIAACGRPLVAEQMQAILRASLAGPTDLNDPLLQFTQEIVSHSIDKYSETVNISPLFSANAALCTPRVSHATLRDQAIRQRTNVSWVEQAAMRTSWSMVKVAPSLRSGVVLMHSRNPAIGAAESDRIRAAFREHGVAVSAYPGGLVRISSPTTAMCDESRRTLADSFRRVS